MKSIFCRSSIGRKRRQNWARILICLCLAFNGGSLFAKIAEQSAQICDQAALTAARETGVPRDILRALTRTETGRGRGGKLQPWPWTLNVAGKGYWFAEKSKAKEFVESTLGKGSKNFDVGCFQINFRWHGHAFRDLSAMLDPTENALYAANFLLKLYKETGTWPDAAAAYHSRTPKYADRYKVRFERIYTGLSPTDETKTPAVVGPRTVIARPKTVNRYPLLTVTQNDVRPTMGSLVPLGAGTTTKPLFMEEG